MTKVFIDGKEGTTGLKIFERFENRADIEVLSIPEHLRKDTKARQEYINQSDVCFLCLPDHAAIEAVELCENPDTVIIDASTAHRTNPLWAYGFPELSDKHREHIKTSKRIATPGCHASGFISLAYPLVSSGILDSSHDMVCFSLTGYTGGGKSMIAQYEKEGRQNEELFLNSPRQYGITQTHKHLREMKYVAGLTKEPLFSPIVADFAQGMQVSLPIYSEKLQGIDNAKMAHEFFSEFYKGQSMVKVLPFGGEGVFSDGFVPSNAYANDNKMYIFISGNDERILMCSLFDNLGKGASGAAVQCMNINLGLDEALGL